MRTPLAVASRVGVFAALSTLATAALGAGAPFAVHVRAAAPADYVVEVDLDPLALPQVQQTEGGLTFTRVVLGSDVARPTAGSPNVPALHRMLAVEPGRSYEVNVTLEGRTTFNNVLLAPAQPDVPDNGAKRPLVFDPRAYTIDRDLGEETATLGHTVQMGPVTLLPLNITPVHYNPARRQMTLWSKVKVYIHANGATGELNPSHTALTPFQAAQISALADNATAVARSFTVAAAPRLLVVTTADLLASAQQLNANGRLPGVNLDVETIPTGATPQNVMSLITAAYAKGDLNAVLFFGDETRVPLYAWPPDAGTTGPTTPGDSWYSMLQGTYYMTVGIGRLPVHNADEASTILGKLYKYDALSRGGYKNQNVILVANLESYPQLYTANQESVRTAPNPRGFHYITEYGGAGATDATLQTAIDGGVGLISYRGHGDTLSWYDWDASNANFAAAQIAPLTNYDNGMAVVFSLACDTGGINATTTAMAASWLLDKSAGGDSNHGAVAVIGSTVDSLTDTNDSFNQYLFNEVQSNTVDMGTVFSQATNELVRDNNGALPMNVKMYILFSDPMLMPWFY